MLFIDDGDAESCLGAALDEIGRAAAKLRLKMSEEPDRVDFRESDVAVDDSDRSRSVFDDVDQ
jgi:hypothetical protein